MILNNIESLFRSDFEQDATAKDYLKVLPG
jgi:hypothetical protein